MGFQLKNISTKQQKDKDSFDIDALLKKEITFSKNSFSNKKKEAFYTELSVLLKAGLELKDALEIVQSEQTKEKHKQLFTGIIEDLISGKNLSDAINSQKQFTEYEYYSLQIGEKTGTLQKVTEELAIYFKRKNDQRRTVISALTYPIIVIVTAILALSFMLNFVVPMFAEIFKRNNVELPWITQLIISSSDGFKKYYWIGIVLVLIIIIFIQVFKQKEWYKKTTSHLLLKTPLIGEFTRKVRLAQFTQAIALLVSAKVPLLNGIQLTKKMIPFYPLQNALNAIEEDILVGKSFHKSIENQKFFDKKMSSLIKVAEETNQTEVIFNRLTQQYNQEIEMRSKMLTAALEPMIILVLGAIVGTILISMYLPMFRLSTVIG